MSRSLYLNSKDSINSTTPHLAQWVVPTLDLNQIVQYGVRVKSVAFNNARYTVHAGNNQINFTEFDGTSNTDTYTITLTNQCYTGSQLATEIASKMTTASTADQTFTYSGSYDSQTKKITITLTNGLPNVFKFNSVSNDAYRLAGFTDADIASQTNAVSQTSDTMVDLAGTKYIDVLSRSLSTANISSSTTGSILCRVPMTTDIGSVIYYINQDPSVLTLRNDNLENIDIELRDDEGSLFVLDANHDFAINLEFTIKSS